MIRFTTDISAYFVSGTARDETGFYTFDISDGRFLNMHRNFRMIRADHKLALRAAIFAAYRCATQGVDPKQSEAA